MVDTYRPKSVPLPDGKIYHHPPICTQWTRKQLVAIYATAGIFSHHDRCLRCGEVADREHRLNWFMCRKDCMTCKRNRKANGAKHVGQFCPQQRYTYPWYFTAGFFVDRAALYMRPGDDGFSEKFRNIRDTELARLRVPARTRGRGDIAIKGRKGISTAIDHNKFESDTIGRSVPELRKRKLLRDRNISPPAGPSEPSMKRQAASCNECGEKGPFARDCPHDKCVMCHQSGHKASMCPQRDTCFSCGETGHRSAHCPRKSGCFNCHGSGHQADACPKKWNRHQRQTPLQNLAGERSESSSTIQNQARKSAEVPIDLRDAYPLRKVEYEAAQPSRLASSMIANSDVSGNHIEAKADAFNEGVLHGYAMCIRDVDMAYASHGLLRGVTVEPAGAAYLHDHTDERSPYQIGKRFGHMMMGAFVAYAENKPSADGRTHREAEVTDMSFSEPLGSGPQSEFWLGVQDGVRVRTTELMSAYEEIKEETERSGNSGV